MKLISNGKTLKAVLKNGDVINGLTVTLQNYKECSGFLFHTATEWTVEENGLSAVAVGQGGEKFTLNAFDTNYGGGFNATFTAGKGQTFERVLRLYISGNLGKSAQTAIYNDNTWLDNNLNRCTFDMRGGAKTTGLVANQSVVGADYVAYKSGVSDYGVLGVISYEHYFSTVELNQNGSFKLYANPNEHWMDLEVIKLQEGDSISTDNFAVVYGKNADVLSLYGKEIKREQKAKNRKKSTSGWCSWYYYGTQISQDIILENAHAIKNQNLDFDYIQIDDGWQMAMGDWEANERFSSGMKKLADDIKELGFKPAIWVAPFFFAKESQTFIKHKDWFIDGGNTKFPMIDYSKKAPREWLRKLFSKLSRVWGYRYIKVDLVLQKLGMNGFEQKGFSALNNFRQALEIMRKAVTKDTVILTCTSPIGASSGLVDSVRTGPDITGTWDSLKNTAQKSIKRYFVNEYLVPDPDCLLVRTAKNEDEGAFRSCIRTDVENDTFTTFVSVMGGAMLSSDKIKLLDKNEIDKIKRMFPLNQKTATPLDIFERDIPSIFYYGKKGLFEMYALINWEDFEQTFTIKRRFESPVYTYYGKEIIDDVKDIQITLKPHASEIIYIAQSKTYFKELENSIMPKQ